MNRIRTLIVDDEQDAANFLSSIVQEYCDHIEIVGMAHSVVEGEQAIHQTKPELLLLDVEMPDGTGFNLLERMDDINFQVIFITAYNHYAIQAIKYSAIDYILKPINIKEFLEAIKKVTKLINSKNQFENQFNHLLENLKHEHPKKIGLPQLDGIEFVDTDHIVRIKAEGSYSSIQMIDNRQMLISKNLGEIQELLLGQLFFRPHNSHLINLKYVKKYVKSDGGYIIMINNDTVPISKTKKESFIKMMATISR